MSLKKKGRRVIKLAINRTVHCVLAVVDEEMVGFSLEHEAALGDPVRYTPDQSSEIGSTVLFVQNAG
jgi:hypothetical protein